MEHAKKVKKHKSEAISDNPLGGCAYGKPKNMWSGGDYCNHIVNKNKLIQSTINTGLKTAEATDVIVDSGTTTHCLCIDSTCKIKNTNKKLIKIKITRQYKNTSYRRMWIGHAEYTQNWKEST